MKNPTPVVILILASWIAVACGIFGCGGCAGKGQYSPPTGTNTTGVYSPDLPASVLVVTVENIRAAALDAMDLLMKTEFENRELLLKANPAIHDFSELVRRDGKKTLDALSQAKIAFQNSRSAEDSTKLKNALAAVQSLLSSSVRYLAEAAAAKKP